MTITRSSLIAAALVLTPSLVALAQISITPPPPATSQPAATAPAEPILPMSATQPTEKPAATAPADALPTAQSVLQGLLDEKPVATPAVKETATSTTAAPIVEGTAPGQPKPKLIREGQFVWNRIGRLVKDDKTGAYFFDFDSDGKQMADPPMGLIPSHLLMSMEEASDKGTRPVKFRVSGEVTEYHGKNYLYVRSLTAIHDLNQGIGR